MTFFCVCGHAKRDWSHEKVDVFKQLADSVGQALAWIVAGDVPIVDTDFAGCQVTRKWTSCGVLCQKYPHGEALEYKAEVYHAVFGRG